MWISAYKINKSLHKQKFFWQGVYANFHCSNLSWNSLITSSQRCCYVSNLKINQLKIWNICTHINTYCLYAWQLLLRRNYAHLDSSIAQLRAQERELISPSTVGITMDDTPEWLTLYPIKKIYGTEIFFKLMQRIYYWKNINLFKLSDFIERTVVFYLKNWETSSRKTQRIMLIMLHYLYNFYKVSDVSFSVIKRTNPNTECLICILQSEDSISHFHNIK